MCVPLTPYFFIVFKQSNLTNLNIVVYDYSHNNVHNTFMPKLVNNTLHALRAYVRVRRPRQYMRSYLNMIMAINIPDIAYIPRRPYVPTMMPTVIGMPFGGISQEDSGDMTGLIGRAVRSVMPTMPQRIVDFDSDDNATWKRVLWHGIRAEQHIDRVPSIYERMGDMVLHRPICTGMPAFKRAVVHQRHAQAAACDTAKRHQKARNTHHKHSTTPKYTRGGGTKPGKFKARFR